MAVEGCRDLLSQLLAQRHCDRRGQLPAIWLLWPAEDSAPWGIQGPKEVNKMRVQTRAVTFIKCSNQIKELNRNFGGTCTLNYLIFSKHQKVKV